MVDVKKYCDECNSLVDFTEEAEYYQEIGRQQKDLEMHGMRHYKFLKGSTVVWNSYCPLCSSEEILMGAVAEECKCVACGFIWEVNKGEYWHKLVEDRERAAHNNGLQQITEILLSWVDGKQSGSLQFNELQQQFLNQFVGKIEKDVTGKVVLEVLETLAKVNAIIKQDANDPEELADRLQELWNKVSQIGRVPISLILPSLGKYLGKEMTLKKCRYCEFLQCASGKKCWRESDGT